MTFLHFFEYLNPMERNVGGIDRIIRIVLGIVLPGVGAILGGAWWILAAIGAISLLTGVIGFCGLYPPLKINTAKKTDTQQ